MEMYRGLFSVDLFVSLLLMLLYLVDNSLQNRHHHDKWEQISIRFAIWYNLPPYQAKAFGDGYRRLNDVCKTEFYYGFLFAKGDNMKAMPIYDMNGNLAGIQTAIPGNMRGFDWQNKTLKLPPAEIMPPVLKAHQDVNGNQYYTVTAYFKHPTLICSPVVPSGVTPGRGLYVQMGYNPENDHMHIPRESRHLSPLWRQGTCVPMMGVHYFMNLSQDLPCEKLYPLFLLYDMSGQLAAFGWVFQGRPYNFYSEDGIGWFSLKPATYPFLFDLKMLPACMFHEDFQVFGIHIYLRDHTKLLCTAVSDAGHTTTLHTPTYDDPRAYQTQPPPQRNIHTSIAESDSNKDLSRHNYPSKEKTRIISAEDYAIEAPDRTVHSAATSRTIADQNFTKTYLKIFTLLIIYFFNSFVHLPS